MVFDLGMRYYHDQGFDVHKVQVDVEELLHWCGKQRCSVDGKARSEFAAHKLREQVDQEAKKG